jgi:hypothetical protein
VRPQASHPWNFNPGAGGRPAGRRARRPALRAVSIDIPFQTNDAREDHRLVSFLIGGAPGTSDQVSVSVEMQPRCGEGEPRPVAGVDVYYGYRGSFADIATRIANHEPNASGAQALITPHPGKQGVGDERMSLVVLDLWGRDFKNGGNPRSGWCGNGRIRIRDLDPAGHLNVDEIRVGNLDDLPYPSTPFGARAYDRDGDSPPRPSYADLHGVARRRGRRPVPSARRRQRAKLRALVTAMSAMAAPTAAAVASSATSARPARTAGAHRGAARGACSADRVL